MQQKKSTLGILAAIGLAALVFGAVAVAGSHDDVRRHEHRSKIVIVDDDGQRHENVFRFDADHPRPFLGVTLGDTQEGALVREVHEDSAADRAGIREDDVIVRFDGQAIESSADLTLAVLGSEPGARVDVEVLRDGSPRTLEVEVGEHEAFAFGFDPDALEEHLERLHENLEGMDFEFDADAFERKMEQMHEKLEGMNFEFDTQAFEEQMEQLHENLQDMDFRFVVPGLADGRTLRRHAGHGRRVVLGVELVEVTPELREHLGADSDRGVLVSRVMSEMPAEAAGIEVGDLIVGVDGDSIEDSGDLRRALRDRTGERVEIEVLRDGVTQMLWAELPEPETLHRHDREGDDDAEGSRHHRFDRPAARYSDADRS